MKISENVYLSQLKNISILWDNDLYTLALFILRSFDAADREINEKNKGSIQKSRPTLHGLAADFAMLTKVPSYIVEKKLKSLGFNIGATVDFDSATKKERP
ncbi:MAG: hypothetical protein R6X11_07765 [Desulfonatronovibrio sp.]